MNKKMFFAGAFALASMCVCAQENDSVKKLDEVVVSDSKFALAKEKSGKVIVKITAEDLKQKSGQTLATILSAVAGLEINGSQSGAGKNLGVYIRGGRNRQTLIIIDGVPVTDASGINFEYDLRLVTAEQVESIEIMKGASSTLYGSGAAAGVINITLKKSGKKKILGTAYSNIGTQQTTQNQKNNPQDYGQGFAVNGTLGKFNYYAALNSTETTGVSEAKGDNFEVDKFSKLNSIVKIGIKPSSKIAIDFYANYDKIKSSFDGIYDNFNSADTNLNKSISEQFRFGFSPKIRYEKGELVLNSSFNTIERHYDTFDVYSASLQRSDYKSRSVNIDVFNKYALGKQVFLVLGSQFQFHEMDATSTYENISRSTAKFNTIDPYVTAVYNSDFGLNINVGSRFNKHSIYGNNLVYNINPSFSFGKSTPIKLLASYSTAYITPSLYQLYSPYGNLNLKPEDNSTIEAGFEINLLNKKLNFNTVAFLREEKNTIGFYTDPITFASNYVNVEGKNNAKGIETSLSYSISKKLKLNGNYTFTQMEEVVNRLIPKHKGNVSLDFMPIDRFLFNVNYQYVDQRNDAFFDGGTFATTKVVLDSYKLVNATAKYELFKNRMSLFGTVSNIFNEDFTENIGYSTRGRNFKIGMLFNFE